MFFRCFAFFLFITLLSLLFISCSGLKGRVVTDGGIMYAMIYDYDNAAVSGVLVKVNGKPIVRSDMHGRFILDFKKKGEYTIELSRRGYETLTQVFEYNPMNVLYFRMITANQLLSLAEIELDNFSYESAEKYLVRANALEPFRIDILYLKSITLFLQRKYAEAERVLLELRERGYNSRPVGLLEERIRKALLGAS
ncbi:MAG: carboxypeptidase-like regulatory domain-containing protein [Spirochaetes bacterium]|nr:carboxypeptidase-like regulatory domain-containing protein [Spirochaetota bacterium]